MERLGTWREKRRSVHAEFVRCGSHAIPEHVVHMLYAGANPNLNIACNTPIAEEDGQVVPYCGSRGLEDGVVAPLPILVRLEEYSKL